MRKIKLMRPHYSGDEIDLIREVLDSEYLVDGPMTREFERLIRETTGAKHAVACTSGTIGLELALRALKVGPGDEVIVPDFTHPATGLVVMSVGAEPVIVDVDRKTFSTTPDIVAAGITEKTRAVIPVSWGGHPLAVREFMTLCGPKEIGVIDDAACSLGTSQDGIPTGKLADFSVFSFHPRKVFATGDGGCVVANDDDHAEFLRSYKAHGGGTQDGRNRFVRPGSNFRFSSVLAALGVAQLRRRDEIIRERRRLAGGYDELLKNVEGVEIPISAPGAFHNFQTYCVFLSKPGARDRALNTLREKGIEVQIGTHAIHREPVFQQARKVGDLAQSQVLADQLLALPLHHHLTEQDQTCIRDELIATFR